MTYAALWCRSNFSFLDGASHAEELIEEAQRLGLAAIGIADRDGVSGMVRAHVKAREFGVKLVAGATVTVAPDGARLAPRRSASRCAPVGCTPVMTPTTMTRRRSRRWRVRGAASSSPTISFAWRWNA